MRWNEGPPPTNTDYRNSLWHSVHTDPSVAEEETGAKKTYSPQDDRTKQLPNTEVSWVKFQRAYELCKSSCYYGFLMLRKVACSIAKAEEKVLQALLYTEQLHVIPKQQHTLFLGRHAGTHQLRLS